MMQVLQFNDLIDYMKQNVDEYHLMISGHNLQAIWAKITNLGKQRTKITASCHKNWLEFWYICNNIMQKSREKITCCNKNIKFSKFSS